MPFGTHERAGLAIALHHGTAHVGWNARARVRSLRRACVVYLREIPAPQTRRVVASLLDADEVLHPPPSAADLRAAGVSAVVVSSAATDRFEFPAVRRVYPRAAALFHDIESGTCGFVRAATFECSVPVWLRPPVEWTDATITVYLSR